MTDTPTPPPGSPPPGSSPPGAPPSGNPGAQPGMQPGAAPITMHGQYIKDLSFENPRAPQSLIEQKQPQLSLNVQVTTRQFDPKTYEVSLVMEANATTPEKEPLFMLELEFAGTVSLGAVPQEAIGPILMIEVPRLLFPFARAIVANTTREAGFPPLNVAPVDFVSLYRQQLQATGGKIPGLPDAAPPTGPVGHA